MPTPRQLVLRERNRQLRGQLFPDVTDDQLWERRSKKGFATIPRCLPILMALMDELSKPKPVSAAYLSLWCARGMTLSLTLAPSSWILLSNRDSRGSGLKIRSLGAWPFLRILGLCALHPALAVDTLMHSL